MNFFTLQTEELNVISGGLAYALTADPGTGVVTAYATQGDLAVPVKLPLGKGLTSLVALALKAFPEFAYKG